MLNVSQLVLYGAPLMHTPPFKAPVLPYKASINLVAGFCGHHCWSWRHQQILAMHALIRQYLWHCTSPVTCSWQQAHSMPLQGRQIAVLQGFACAPLSYTVTCLSSERP